MMYTNDTTGEELSHRALQDRLGASFPRNRPPAGWSVKTPPAPTFVDLQQRKRGEIEYQRQQAIDGGFDHAGIPVQTRPQDRENLQGLVTAAQLRQAAGDTTPIQFRDADNAMHDLTPAEVIALGLAALAHVEAQYQRSWALKAQIEAATSADDLDAIIW